MKKSFCTAALLLAPLVTLLIIEFLQDSILLPPISAVVNYLILAVPCWLLFWIFNSFPAAVLPPCALALILGVANHYVIIFRSSSLQPWDIQAAGAMTNLASSITLSLDLSVICAILWFILLCVLSFLGILKSRRKRSLKQLACTLLAGVVLLVGMQGLGSDNRDDFWDTVSAARKNGFMLNFMSNLKIMHNTPPEGYDAQALKQLSFDAAPQASHEQPNIIVIMNEAFADLSIYSDLHTDRDPMEFVNSLDGAASGSLVVPVFGGGTCNTEYEFLTGNSCFMLKPGRYPMQQFITRESPSIATVLRAQGYDTTAIHPYYPNGWNRSRSYPLLGFDKFISLEDFENPEILRQFVSDRCTYEKIINITEAASKPQFIFCITMQNHLGYDIKYENFEEDIFFPDCGKYPQVQQYLSLIDESDDAIKDLIEYYKTQDTPTYILFFGDHQPALEAEYMDKLYEESTLSQEELTFAQYTVPFFIWYNKGEVECEHSNFSSNYLGAVLLKTVGAQTTPYNNFLLDMMDKLPVVSARGIMDTGGNVYDITDASPYSKLLNTYDCLQYNQVFDTANRYEPLFYIK